MPLKLTLRHHPREDNKPISRLIGGATVKITRFCWRIVRLDFQWSIVERVSTFGDLLRLVWERVLICSTGRLPRYRRLSSGLFPDSNSGGTGNGASLCGRDDGRNDDAMERQALNVFRMRLLGAVVRAVHSGTATLKDATSEAIRDWVTNVETMHSIMGSVAGPLHPYPMMVREFHAVIGKETRKQALEKCGGKPDVLVACVGGVSNAMGLFHEFVDDADVRLIGVEAAGFGLDSGKHAATLTKESFDYPGVGPEHSFLKDIGRAEYHSAEYHSADEEALEAFKRLSRLEGIIPALETSHAVAHLDKLCPTLLADTKGVVNCSGRGDKDVHTAIKYLQV